MIDDFNKREREKERYFDNKERELKVFIVNLAKDCKNIEDDIEYYKEEV